MALGGRGGPIQNALVQRPFTSPSVCISQAGNPPVLVLILSSILSLVSPWPGSTSKHVAMLNDSSADSRTTSTRFRATPLFRSLPAIHCTDQALWLLRGSWQLVQAADELIQLLSGFIDPLTNAVSLYPSWWSIEH